MSFPRSARSLLLACIAGCAPLTLALALPNQPAPPAAPASALQVARLLDTIAQSRFQDTSRMVFGLSRMGPQLEKHPVVSFTPRNSEEAKTLRVADGSRHDYLVSFFHCTPLPDVFHASGNSFPPTGNGFNSLFLEKPQPPPVSLLFKVGNLNTATLVFLHSQAVTAKSPSVISVQDRLQTEAVRALPTLRAGQEVQTVITDWTVLMRPVLAAQDSCLGCHTAAKKGDTLGVMVYAVRNTVSKP